MKPAIPVKVRRDLFEIALNSAAKEGVRHPHDIQAVRVRSGVRFTPPIAPGRENWVYLIAMWGHFKRCGKHTGGVRTPRGTVPARRTIAHAATRGRCVLEVAVLGSTLEALFVTHRSAYPDLSSQGTPFRLAASIDAAADGPQAGAVRLRRL